MSERVEGRHPVREALRAGRARKIVLASGAQVRGVLEDIIRLAEQAGVPVERVARADIDRWSATGAHQGVMAEVAPREVRSWRDGIAAARRAGRVPFVLALDGIEDPQNLGALLRTAEAFAVDAVIVPKRRSAAVGAAVAKASAGALEHVLLDQVANLERTLAACREDGLWIVAAAGDGAVEVQACDLLTEPVTIVVGSEGRGVSALITRRADAVVKIPLAGRVASLNASVAGAVMLWEAFRRRERG
jgi:23S rRNA (guanosine2251-2'-O)-methyltransferase